MTFKEWLHRFVNASFRPFDSAVDRLAADLKVVRNADGSIKTVIKYESTFASMNANGAHSILSDFLKELKNDHELIQELFAQDFKKVDLDKFEDYTNAYTSLVRKEARFKTTISSLKSMCNTAIDASNTIIAVENSLSKSKNKNIRRFVEDFKKFKESQLAILHSSAKLINELDAKELTNIINHMNGVRAIRGALMDKDEWDKLKAESAVLLINIKKYESALNDLDSILKTAFTLFQTITKEDAALEEMLHEHMLVLEKGSKTERSNGGSNGRDLRDRNELFDYVKKVEKGESQKY